MVNKGGPDTSKHDFLAALAEIYQDLLARQEPLGDDLTRVWDDNIEDLYEE